MNETRKPRIVDVPKPNPLVAENVLLRAMFGPKDPERPTVYSHFKQPEDNKHPVTEPKPPKIG